MKLLKLVSPVTDSVTGLDGVLTHANVYNGNVVEYVFQPKSLNKISGQPAGIAFVYDNRIKGDWEDVDVPIDLIGKDAEDTGTGFKGKIAAFTYHMNGCIHAAIKPPGLNKDGEMFATSEFDIRRLKIEGIKKKIEKVIKKEQVEKPSPSPFTSKPH